MKKGVTTSLIICLFLTICNYPLEMSTVGNLGIPAQVTISKAKLMSKIKVGWAGQTIGYIYGYPTEFKFNGTMIQDYVPIDRPDVAGNA